MFVNQKIFWDLNIVLEENCFDITYFRPLFLIWSSDLDILKKKLFWEWNLFVLKSIQKGMNFQE